MDRRAFESLSEGWEEFERMVDLTPGIDPWCSGPDWVVPAHLAFAGHGDPLILWKSGTAAALMDRVEADAGTVLGSLEPLWGFASVLLGPDLGVAADAVAAALEPEPWRFGLLSGLPFARTTVDAVADPLSRLGTLRAGPGIVRQVADLSDGVDAWLGRRSARFRRTLRRLRAEAAAAGVRFVDVDDSSTFDRCVAVERHSWKGAEDSGILGAGMYEFYETMCDRLVRRRRLRSTIATIDGVDVAFIIGGVRNDRYRGLQISFAESVRGLSLSHLLQWHTIERLTEEEPWVRAYDLGMDMEYKRRWADRTERSLNVVVERHDSRRRRRIG